jgi:hypothetical protein
MAAAERPSRERERALGRVPRGTVVLLARADELIE